jgi:hypothetical protein
MNAASFLSPAQLLGYLALVLGVAAFSQKSDVRLKVLMSCEGFVYVAHFILLGNYPASCSAGVSSVRMLVSLRSRAPAWIAVFIGLNVALGLAFAKSAAGWLPISASCLATVGVFVMHGLAMRLVLFVCTLLWLVNNALSGSIGGTVLEALIALSNLATIGRLVAERAAQRRAVGVCAAVARAGGDPAAAS